MQEGSQLQYFLYASWENFVVLGKQGLDSPGGIVKVN